MTGTRVSAWPQWSKVEGGTKMAMWARKMVMHAIEFATVGGVIP